MSLIFGNFWNFKELLVGLIDSVILTKMIHVKRDCYCDLKVYPTFFFMYLFIHLFYI